MNPWAARAGLTLALAGCAAARPQTPANIALVAAAGDLPPATPETVPLTDHAETGTPVRLVLGARRERATEMFTRFLRALGRHDLPSVAQLLDTTVYDVDSGDTEPREVMITELDAMLSRVDPNQLMAMIPSVRTTVRSAGEWRRQGRPMRFPLGADDWYVESSVRAQPTAFFQLPQRIVVRFLGDEPVIVALSAMRGRLR